MRRRTNETKEDFLKRQRAYMALYRKNNKKKPLTEEQKKRAHKVRKIRREKNKASETQKRKEIYWKNKEAELAQNKKYREKNFATLRERELKRRYGIDSATYREIFFSQREACAICLERSPDRNLDVDHCHDTGVVRGLLCRKCNTLLGHARNSPEILLLAADYLLP